MAIHWIWWEFIAFYRWPSLYAAAFITGISFLLIICLATNMWVKGLKLKTNIRMYVFSLAHERAMRQYAFLTHCKFYVGIWAAQKLEELLCMANVGRINRSHFASNGYRHSIVSSPTPGRTSFCFSIENGLYGMRVLHRCGPEGSPSERLGLFIE